MNVGGFFVGVSKGVAEEVPADVDPLDVRDGELLVVSS